MSAWIAQFRRFPRWFRLSLLYPVVTLAFAGFSAVLPMGGTFGALGYVLALLAFILNLPGVLVVQRFYHSTASPTTGAYSFLLVAALITWLACIIPLACLASAIARRLRRASR